MENLSFPTERNILNIVLPGLPNTLPKRDEKYKLHRMLSALFSIGLTSNERIEQGKQAQAKETALYLHKIGLDNASIATAVNRSIAQVEEWVSFIVCALSQSLGCVVGWKIHDCQKSLADVDF